MKAGPAIGGTESWKTLGLSQAPRPMEQRPAGQQSSSLVLALLCDYGHALPLSEPHFSRCTYALMSGQSSVNTIMAELLGTERESWQVRGGSGWGGLPGREGLWAELW